MAKWKKLAKQQARTIESLREQIDGQRAYEHTLQQCLEIAKKDARDARQWAERAELATALSDDREGGT